MISMLLFAAFAVVFFFFVIKPLFFGAARIGALEAEVKLKAGTAVLVDVREPAEWMSGVAAPAVLLPMSDLQGDRRLWKPFLEGHKSKLIIVYCASGMRSSSVAASLLKEGYQAANLGGFGKWSSSGLPVRKP